MALNVEQSKPMENVLTGERKFPFVVSHFPEQPIAKNDSPGHMITNPSLKKQYLFVFCGPPQYVNRYLLVLVE